MSDNFWKTALIRWEKSRYDGFFSRFFYASLWTRQQYIARVVSQLPTGTKIIELGCGTSRILELIQNREQIQYIGVDISEEAVVQARNTFRSIKNAQWICASIEDLENIEADYAISAGLMDWITDNQLKSFLKNNNIKYHCHSFSIFDDSIRYYLHKIFTLLIRLGKNTLYKPRYYSEECMLSTFSSIQGFKIYKNRKLSFGAFVHNLADNFFENQDKRVEKYFKKKSNTSNIFEKIYKKKELSDFLKIKTNYTGSNILEIGSGVGFYSKLILQHPINQLIAIDPYVHTNNFVDSKNFQFFLKKIENNGFGQEFQKIFCLGVIEFVDDVDLFFKQILKHVRSDTEIFLTVPYSKGIGYFFYKKYHRWFNRISLQDFELQFIVNKIRVYFPNYIYEVKSYGYLNKIFHIKSSDLH